jgi:hypothetical protein
MDGDNKKDLVVAAEWSPITVLLNKEGQLIPLTLQGSGLEKSSGWWNVVEAGDFDKDGDVDLVAGNLGLNSKLGASPVRQVKMYVGDFDQNDSIDQVLTHVANDVEYPFSTRDEMTKQMPFLRKKYLSYHEFAEASISDMFSKRELADATQYETQIFESAYIENLGSNKFRISALSKGAQFSTVNAVLIEDFDGDENLDVLLGGNFHHPNIQMGRYDASYGLLLKGDGRGNLYPLQNNKSGLSITGQVSGLKSVKVGNRTFYLAVRNNQPVQIFTLNR